MLSISCLETNLPLHWLSTYESHQTEHAQALDNSRRVESDTQFWANSLISHSANIRNIIMNVSTPLCARYRATRQRCWWMMLYSYWYNRRQCTNPDRQWHDTTTWMNKRSYYLHVACRNNACVITSAMLDCADMTSVHPLYGVGQRMKRD